MYSAPSKFKQLINDYGYILTGGIYDPISAKVAAMAGMKVLYISGYSQSLSLLSKSDMEFVQREQAVDNARRIVEALEDKEVPVIADADTGYGSVCQTQYTVQQFEKAGVAGVHLEDQTIPKRCGHIAGKAVISREEATAKIKVAVDSKKDKDFIIIARTDALGAVGGSLDEAVERGVAYHNAGADFIWCEFGSPSRELARDFAFRIKSRVPSVKLAFNYSSSFNWHKENNPMQSFELYEMGYQYIFITLFGIHAATHSIYNAFQDLALSGVIAQWEMEERKMGHPTQSHHVLGDTKYYQELEKRYLGSEAEQRLTGSEGYV